MIIGLGIGFILAGLFVIVDQAFVAAELQPLIGSAAGTADPSGGLTPFGTTSYLVYVIAIGLIGTGAGLVRMTFHGAVTGYAMGGTGVGAMGMSPEAMQSLLASSTAAMNRMPPGTTTVKVKCKNCGSLEEEDAKFCHKCGQAM